MGIFDDRTLVGVASVIAALASLVSAVASALNHRKLNQMNKDDEEGSTE